jgi:hypothetical protein
MAWERTDERTPPGMQPGETRTSQEPDENDAGTLIDDHR